MKPILCNGVQCDVADALVRENAELSQQLGNLLAVIHRDDGGYRAQYGNVSAVSEAIMIVSGLRQELDSALFDLKVGDEKLKTATAWSDRPDWGRQLPGAELYDRAMKRHQPQKEKP
jgi:hypothetical protein